MTKKHHDEDDEDDEDEDEESKEVFNCLHLNEGCIFNDDTGTTIICTRAPCSLNVDRFGVHQRILNHYIAKEDWDSAFYYFNDLSSISIFDCDVQQLYDMKKHSQNKKLEPSDYPLGCRVFKGEEDLSKMLETILGYKKQELAQIDGEEGTKISREGLEIYSRTKVRFRKTILSNLAILKHISIDRKEKDRAEQVGFERYMKLYMAAVAAHKAGIEVETSISEALETGFTKQAVKGALFARDYPKTMELASLNKRKIIDARLSMGSKLEEDKVIELLEKKKKTEKELKDLKRLKAEETKKLRSE